MARFMRFTYLISKISIVQITFLVFKKVIKAYKAILCFLFNTKNTPVKHKKIVADIKYQATLALRQYKQNHLSELVFKSKNESETIKLETENLIYLESMGHYVKAYIKNTSGEVRLKIIRNTFSNVVNEMDNFALKNFFACHKSYYINVFYLDSIHGNSSKSFFKLHGIESKIPISKTIYKAITEYSKTTTIYKNQESECVTSYQVAY